MRLTVLYICPDETLGGSTRSLLNMIQATKNIVSPIVLFSSEGLASEEFRRNGIETMVHPYIKLYAKKSWKDVLTHPWRALLFRILRQDIACVRYVIRYLKGRKIDIVHSNYSPIYIGLLLSKVLHAKHVWHVREFIDLDFHYHVYGGLKLLRRKVNKADARVAITSAIRDHWRMPNNNTWVIPNAIRSNREVVYVKEKQKYILFSAYSMTEAKGTRKAIIAFTKSCVYKDGFILKLMGNCLDEYKKSLLQTINDLGIKDYVEFIPCQSDIKPYFAHATAYLMTSDFEALGRVTGEAMFYGCPVIAHATGGTLDLVQHDITGYLYNEIDECAELIQKVCATNQMEMIMRAQKFAINNLSQEVYGPKIIEVYNKVLTY